MALQKLKENDSQNPATTKKSSAVVLDEDTFAQNLESIIVRDFYPDLPRLQAQQEYLNAWERNDTEKLREIHIKYGPKRNSSKTPNIYATPATFDTPVEQPKHTPRGPPDKGGVETSQGEAELSEGEEDVPPTHNPEPEPVNNEKGAADLPLDKFLAKHTSEDNAAFEEIMVEADKKHRAHHAWLYEKQATQQKEKEERLAVKSVEQQAIEGSNTKTLTWTYIPKNSLMYVPEGVELSEEEKLAQVGKARQVVHKNSRFTRNPFNLEKSKESISQAASSQALAMQGKIGADGKEVLPQQMPTVEGHGFVATPSPAPGVDESPLMTWGEIEGTPFRLDGSDTPLVHKTPGPIFKIPDVPKRDRLAMKLAEDASKAHRAKKQEAIKAMKANFASPSPKFGAASKTDRLGYLSPAAQRLASARLGVRTNTDKALRASYTPSPTHRQFEDKTPILTPGSSRRTPKGTRTPSASPSPKTTSKRDSTTELASLTDNLLNLPKRNKAQDYF